MSMTKPQQDTVFISGLPYSFDPEVFRNYIQNKVGQCEILKAWQNRELRLLYVVLQFESAVHAVALLKRYNHKIVLGHKLGIAWYNKDRKSGTLGRINRTSIGINRIDHTDGLDCRPPVKQRLGVIRQHYDGDDRDDDYDADYDDERRRLEERRYRVEEELHPVDEERGSYRDEEQWKDERDMDEVHPQPRHRSKEEHPWQIDGKRREDPRHAFDDLRVSTEPDDGRYWNEGEREYDDEDRRHSYEYKGPRRRQDHNNDPALYEEDRHREHYYEIHNERPPHIGYEDQQIAGLSRGRYQDSVEEGECEKTDSDGYASRDIGRRRWVDEEDARPTTHPSSRPRRRQEDLCREQEWSHPQERTRGIEALAGFEGRHCDVRQISHFEKHGDDHDSSWDYEWERNSAERWDTRERREREMFGSERPHRFAGGQRRSVSPPRFSASPRRDRPPPRRPPPMRGRGRARPPPRRGTAPPRDPLMTRTRFLSRNVFEDDSYESTTSDDTNSSSVKRPRRTHAARDTQPRTRAHKARDSHVVNRNSDQSSARSGSSLRGSSQARDATEGELESSESAGEVKDLRSVVCKVVTTKAEKENKARGSLGKSRIATGTTTPADTRIAVHAGSAASRKRHLHPAKGDTPPAKKVKTPTPAKRIVRPGTPESTCVPSKSKEKTKSKEKSTGLKTKRAVRLCGKTAPSTHSTSTVTSVAAPPASNPVSDSKEEDDSLPEDDLRRLIMSRRCVSVTVLNTDESSDNVDVVPAAEQAAVNESRETKDAATETEVFETADVLQVKWDICMESEQELLSEPEMFSFDEMEPVVFRDTPVIDLAKKEIKKLVVAEKSRWARRTKSGQRRSDVPSSTVICDDASNESRLKRLNKGMLSSQLRKPSWADSESDASDSQDGGEKSRTRRRVFPRKMVMTKALVPARSTPDESESNQAVPNKDSSPVTRTNNLLNDLAKVFIKPILNKDCTIKTLAERGRWGDSSEKPSSSESGPGVFNKRYNVQQSLEGQYSDCPDSTDDDMITTSKNEVDETNTFPSHSIPAVCLNEQPRGSSDDALAKNKSIGANSSLNDNKITSEHETALIGNGSKELDTSDSVEKTDDTQEQYDLAEQNVTNVADCLVEVVQMVSVTKLAAIPVCNNGELTTGTSSQKSVQNSNDSRDNDFPNHYEDNTRDGVFDSQHGDDIRMKVNENSIECDDVKVAEIGEEENDDATEYEHANGENTAGVYDDAVEEGHSVASDVTNEKDFPENDYQLLLYEAEAENVDRSPEGALLEGQSDDQSGAVQVEITDTSDDRHDMDPILRTESSKSQDSEEKDSYQTGYLDHEGEVEGIDPEYIVLDECTQSDECEASEKGSLNSSVEGQDELYAQDHTENRVDMGDKVLSPSVTDGGQEKPCNVQHTVEDGECHSTMRPCSPFDVGTQARERLGELMLFISHKQIAARESRPDSPKFQTQGQRSYTDNSNQSPCDSTVEIAWEKKNHNELCAQKDTEERLDTGEETPSLSVTEIGEVSVEGQAYSMHGGQFSDVCTETSDEEIKVGFSSQEYNEIDENSEVLSFNDYTERIERENFEVLSLSCNDNMELIGEPLAIQEVENIHKTSEGQYSDCSENIENTVTECKYNKGAEKKHPLFQEDMESQHKELPSKVTQSENSVLDKCMGHAVYEGKHDDQDNVERSSENVEVSYMNSTNWECSAHSLSSEDGRGGFSEGQFSDCSVHVVKEVKPETIGFVEREDVDNLNLKSEMNHGSIYVNIEDDGFGKLENITSNDNVDPIHTESIYCIENSAQSFDVDEGEHIGMRSNVEGQYSVSSEIAENDSYPDADFSENVSGHSDEHLQEGSVENDSGYMDNYCDNYEMTDRMSGTKDGAPIAGKNEHTVGINKSERLLRETDQQLSTGQFSDCSDSMDEGKRTLSNAKLDCKDITCAENDHQVEVHSSVQKDIDLGQCTLQSTKLEPILSREDISQLTEAVMTNKNEAEFEIDLSDKETVDNMTDKSVVCETVWEVEEEAQLTKSEEEDTEHFESYKTALEEESNPIGDDNNTADHKNIEDLNVAKVLRETQPGEIEEFVEENEKHIEIHETGLEEESNDPLVQYNNTAHITNVEDQSVADISHETQPGELEEFEDEDTEHFESNESGLEEESRHPLVQANNTADITNADDQNAAVLHETQPGELEEFEEEETEHIESHETYSENESNDPFELDNSTAGNKNAEDQNVAMTSHETQPGELEEFEEEDAEHFERHATYFKNVSSDPFENDNNTASDITNVALDLHETQPGELEEESAQSNIQVTDDIQLHSRDCDGKGLLRVVDVEACSQVPVNIEEEEIEDHDPLQSEIKEIDSLGQDLTATNSVSDASACDPSDVSVQEILDQRDADCDPSKPECDESENSNEDESSSSLSNSETPAVSSIPPDVGDQSDSDDDSIKQTCEQSDAVNSDNCGSPETRDDSDDGMSPETRDGSDDGLSPETRDGSDDGMLPETRDGSDDGMSPETRDGSDDSMSPETRDDSDDSMSPETRDDLKDIGLDHSESERNPADSTGNPSQSNVDDISQSETSNIPDKSQSNNDQEVHNQSDTRKHISDPGTLVPQNEDVNDASSAESVTDRCTQNDITNVNGNESSPVATEHNLESENTEEVDIFERSSDHGPMIEDNEVINDASFTESVTGTQNDTTNDNGNESNPVATEHNLESENTEEVDIFKRSSDHDPMIADNQDVNEASFVESVTGTQNDTTNDNDNENSPVASVQIQESGYIEDVKGLYFDEENEKLPDADICGNVNDNDRRHTVGIYDMQRRHSRRPYREMSDIQNNVDQREYIDHPIEANQRCPPAGMNIVPDNFQGIRNAETFDPCALGRPMPAAHAVREGPVDYQPHDMLPQYGEEPSYQWNAQSGPYHQVPFAPMNGSCIPQVYGDRCGEERNVIIDGREQPPHHNAPYDMFHNEPIPGQVQHFERPTQHLPYQTPCKTYPTPHLPYPTPHLPNPTPHLPHPTPHLHHLAPHLPNPTPHLPNPTPHLPNPTPHLPNPTPHLRNPSPHLPNPTSHFPITDCRELGVHQNIQHTTEDSTCNSDGRQCSLFDVGAQARTRLGELMHFISHKQKANRVQQHYTENSNQGLCDSTVEIALEEENNLNVDPGNRSIHSLSTHDSLNPMLLAPCAPHSRVQDPRDSTLQLSAPYQQEAQAGRYPPDISYIVVSDDTDTDEERRKARSWRSKLTLQDFSRRELAQRPFAISHLERSRRYEPYSPGGATSFSDSELELVKFSHTSRLEEEAKVASVDMEISSDATSKSLCSRRHSEPYSPGSTIPLSDSELEREKSSTDSRLPTQALQTQVKRAFDEFVQSLSSTILKGGTKSWKKELLKRSRRYEPYSPGTITSLSDSELEIVKPSHTCRFEKDDQLTTVGIEISSGAEHPIDDLEKYSDKVNGHEPARNEQKKFTRKGRLRFPDARSRSVLSRSRSEPYSPGSTIPLSDSELEQEKSSTDSRLPTPALRIQLKKAFDKFSQSHPSATAKVGIQCVTLNEVVSVGGSSKPYDPESAPLMHHLLSSDTSSAHEAEPSSPNSSLTSSSSGGDADEELSMGVSSTDLHSLLGDEEFEDGELIGSEEEALTDPSHPGAQSISDGHDIPQSTVAERIEKPVKRIVKLVGRPIENGGPFSESSKSPCKGPAKPSGRRASLPNSEMVTPNVPGANTARRNSFSPDSPRLPYTDKERRNSFSPDSPRLPDKTRRHSFSSDSQANTPRSVVSVVKETKPAGNSNERKRLKSKPFCSIVSEANPSSEARKKHGRLSDSKRKPRSRTESARMSSSPSKSRDPTLPPSSSHKGGSSPSDDSKTKTVKKTPMSKASMSSSKSRSSSVKSKSSVDSKDKQPNTSTVKRRRDLRDVTKSCDQSTSKLSVHLSKSTSKSSASTSSTMQSASTSKASPPRGVTRPTRPSYSTKMDKVGNSKDILQRKRKSSTRSDDYVAGEGKGLSHAESTLGTSQQPRPVLQQLKSVMQSFLGKRRSEGGSSQGECIPKKAKLDGETEHLLDEGRDLLEIALEASISTTCEGEGLKSNDKKSPPAATNPLKSKEALVQRCSGAFGDTSSGDSSKLVKPTASSSPTKKDSVCHKSSKLSPPLPKGPPPAAEKAPEPTTPPEQSPDSTVGASMAANRSSSPGFVPPLPIGPPPTATNNAAPPPGDPPEDGFGSTPDPSRITKQPENEEFVPPLPSDPPPIEAFPLPADPRRKITSSTILSMLSRNPEPGSHSSQPRNPQPGPHSMQSRKPQPDAHSSQSRNLQPGPHSSQSRSPQPGPHTMPSRNPQRGPSTSGDYEETSKLTSTLLDCFLVRTSQACQYSDSSMNGNRKRKLTFRESDSTTGAVGIINSSPCTKSDSSSGSEGMSDSSNNSRKRRLSTAEFEKKVRSILDKREQVEKAYKQECTTLVEAVKRLASNKSNVEGDLQELLRTTLHDISQKYVNELATFVREETNETTGRTTLRDIGQKYVNELATFVRDETN